MVFGSLFGVDDVKQVTSAIRSAFDQMSNCESLEEHNVRVKAMEAEGKWSQR